MEKKTNRLVVADAGWAETIPEWLKKQVEAERITEGFAGVIGKGNGETVGLAETCVYLYTLGLHQPLDHDYAQIHLWVSGTVMSKANGGEVPDFIKEVLEQGLSEYQTTLLNELRYKLYRARGGAIKSPLFDALKTLRKKIKKEAN